MERYLRVFNFAFRVFGMSRQSPVLLAPIAANIALAAPFMLGSAVAMSLVETHAGQYTLLAVGITVLYFIDYFCNAATASLIFDQVTTGSPDLGVAFQRTRRVFGGIALFAAISAMFDLLQAYANERDDIVAKVAARVLYAVWTTATYVVMPAMVLEGLGFGAAFSRSKQLASDDPTNVGIGALAIGVANYALGGVVFFLANKLYGSVGESSPILGALLFYTVINVYWALSGYLKITYFTCFYLWARECERTHSSSPSLAPEPLAAVL